jgi:hypothetical protein
MAVYCREVRKLEDKFNSLELNHVPHDSMRPPTSLRKWHMAENSPRLASLLVTSTSLRSILRSHGTTVASRPCQA